MSSNWDFFGNQSIPKCNPQSKRRAGRNEAYEIQSDGSVKIVPKYKAVISYVYFIQCHSFVKVGFSKSPKKRFENLQIGCPYELQLLKVIKCEDPREYEKYFHKKYADKHFRGEWFHISDSIYKDIMNETE